MAFTRVVAWHEPVCLAGSGDSISRSDGEDQALASDVSVSPGNAGMAPAAHAPAIVSTVTYRYMFGSMLNQLKFCCQFAGMHAIVACCCAKYRMWSACTCTTVRKLLLLPVTTCCCVAPKALCFSHNSTVLFGCFYAIVMQPYFARPVKTTKDWKHG